MEMEHESIRSLLSKIIEVFIHDTIKINGYMNRNIHQTAFQSRYISESKNLDPLSERLVFLGIMGTQLRATIESLITIAL